MCAQDWVLGACHFLSGLEIWRNVWYCKVGSFFPTLFGRSYSLSPPGGSQEPHILSPPPSAEMGWNPSWEGHFLQRAVYDFSTSSHHLVSWGRGLMKSCQAKAFALLEGFPLGCKGPRESWVIPWTHNPSTTSSLMEPPATAIPVSRGGSKVLSYPIPALPRAAPASLLSIVWLLWVSDDFCVIGISLVGM